MSVMDNSFFMIFMITCLTILAACVLVGGIVKLGESRLDKRASRRPGGSAPRSAQSLAREPLSRWARSAVAEYCHPIRTVRETVVALRQFPAVMTDEVKRAEILKAVARTCEREGTFNDILAVEVAGEVNLPFDYVLTVIAEEFASVFVTDEEV